MLTPLLVLLGAAVGAQQMTIPALEATPIDQALKIDGYFTEDAWMNAKEATGFWTNFPADTTLAKGQTVVRVLYDHDFVYIGAVLYNHTSVGRYVASSLRRDYPFAENDAFGVILDTYRDQTNGYGFYVSAYGVQREEQIFAGITTDGTWDTKWYSAVSQDSASWSVEMAIPLKYVRFKEAMNEWNINFVRNDIAANERSSWARVPRNFSMINLAYHGTLEWPEHLKRVKKNYSIIPSLTYAASQTADDAIGTHARLSLDGKISITSALNLDVTINPDFSQAEVDQVQLNITRFELVFPEKRFFFIENSDLFSQFGIQQTGTSTIRPFYSRRIGLQYNAARSQWERTPLLGGLRLSGKINKNLRVGAMSVQTDALDTPAEQSGATLKFPSQNYSVLAVQQKVFSRSNIGIIVENRQAMKPDSVARFSFDQRNYNRLIGAEYNLASANNTWTGKVFTNYTWDHRDKIANAQGVWLSRNTLRSASYVGYTKAGKEFQPDMGFVPRNNFSNFYTEADYKFYTKKPAAKLNFVAPIIHYDIYLDSLGKKTDHQWRYGLYVTFKNTAYFYLLGWNEYTRLTAPFNPAQTEGPMLPPGSVHRYAAVSLYYETDFRKNRFGTLWIKTGQYFNGNFVQVTVNLNQKVQPWGTVGLNVDFNRIQLPKPYANNTLYAIGPKADISFSKSLFFNTIVQYNNQNENLNVYARVQWRFRPLSDFYIIYTNNHDVNPWLRRDQALTAKLVYWL
ncbi:DUF5916 domain-containing protein [Chryseolinea serpens]|nr:DUF5916 domain-containing protein [Chryseolinea serpens]